HGARSVEQPDLMGVRVEVGYHLRRALGLQIDARLRGVGRTGTARHDGTRDVEVLLDVGDVRVVGRARDRRVGRARRARRIVIDVRAGARAELLPVFVGRELLV